MIINVLEPIAKITVQIRDSQSPAAGDEAQGPGGRLQDLGRWPSHNLEHGW